MGGLSRRRILGLGCTALGALAGCGSSGDTIGATGASVRTPTFTDSVDIDGKFLVVTLPHGHDIKKVTLVDPDGEYFASRSVPVGVTRVRFELLDPRLMGSDYVHYDPGVYELVGTGAGGTYRQAIPLVPDVRIVDVRQVRDEALPMQFVGLVVTVENVGTGPTWVYDIAYAGSPYGSADSGITDSPGDPIFAYPERPDVSVLGPTEAGEFVDFRRPLLFEDESDCNNETSEMEVRIGIASGDQTVQTIRLTSGGEATKDSLYRRWVCKSVDIEVLDGG